MFNFFFGLSIYKVKYSRLNVLIQRLLAILIFPDCCRILSRFDLKPRNFAGPNHYPTLYRCDSGERWYTWQRVCGTMFAICITSFGLGARHRSVRGRRCVRNFARGVVIDAPRFPLATRIATRERETETLCP